MKIRDGISIPTNESHYHPVRWWVTKPGLSWRLLATAVEKIAARKKK